VAGLGAARQVVRQSGVLEAPLQEEVLLVVLQVEGLEAARQEEGLEVVRQAASLQVEDHEGGHQGEGLGADPQHQVALSVVRLVVVLSVAPACDNFREISLC